MNLRISILGIVLVTVFSTCAKKQNREIAGDQSISQDITDDSSAIQKISDDSLLTLVQYQTFNYFWEGAEPNSGLARERSR